MSSGLKFELKPVKEIPRGYRKSKYDLIINEFIESGEKLVSVNVEGKSVNYVRSQLGKRIELRGLEEELKASSVSGTLYLEKVS
jgi:hypothetical protein